MLRRCRSGVAETASDHLEGTVSLWHFFSDREAEVIQSVVDDFETANPDVTVDVHSGQDDEKLQKAIAAGNNVDVGISYSTDIVGAFCSSGAFRDLGPYIERDGVGMDQFGATTASCTQFEGTRCARSGARRCVQALREQRSPRGGRLRAGAPERWRSSRRWRSR